MCVCMCILKECCCCVPVCVGRADMHYSVVPCENQQALYVLGDEGEVGVRDSSG